MSKNLGTRKHTTDTSRSTVKREEKRGETLRNDEELAVLIRQWRVQNERIFVFSCDLKMLVTTQQTFYAKLHSHARSHRDAQGACVAGAGCRALTEGRKEGRTENTSPLELSRGCNHC